MRIERLVRGDEPLLAAAADLFDSLPNGTRTARFLSDEGHHLLLARDAA